jgi:sporulation protein YlmC with PRC-barrel domain
MVNLLKGVTFMENRIKWGSKAISSDGKDLGRVIRVVVHPKNNEVTHIVIEKGIFNRVAKLIPISTVFFAAPDEVRLKIDSTNVESLQDYEETFFVTGEEIENMESGVTPVYWLRPVGDYAELYPLPPLNTSINVPKDTKSMEPGCEICTAEDKVIGRVRSFVLNDEGKITHMIADIGGFGSKKRKLIPVDWIEKIDECRVHISASAIMIEKLVETE